MHLLRQPQHTRRKINLINPLLGKTYNNFDSYSTSYLDEQIKLSTKASDQILESQRYVQIDNSFNRTYTSQRKSVNENNKNEKVTHRTYIPQKFLNYCSVLMSKNMKPFEQSAQKLNKIKSRTSSKIEKLKDKKGIQQTASSTKNESFNKIKQKIRIKTSQGVRQKTFSFPEVQIRLINKILSVKLIKEKSINIKLQCLLKQLFKKQIIGEFTQQFMFYIEKYMKITNERQILYSNPNNIALQLSDLKISKKCILVQYIKDLEREGNIDKIIQVVKYYCRPSKEQGLKILQKLINNLIIEIFQKKNCSRDAEYVLLAENGNLLTNISQISFNTKVLLLVEKQNYAKTFQRYSLLLQDQKNSTRKNFQEEIKLNFVKNMIKNEIYHPQENQVQIKQADYGQILCLTKFQQKMKRNKSHLNSKINFKQNSYKDIDDIKLIMLKLKQKRKKKIINENKLYKLFQHILDPQRKYKIQTKLDRKTREQFIILHHFNESIDLNFNNIEGNQNKLLIQNLFKNCSYLKNKNKTQANKLYILFQKLYGKSDETLNQITYQNFKEINETAHGVGEKEVIIKLITNYLNFDEFGLISRNQFRTMLSIAIDRKDYKLNVIEGIIWDWLDAEGLIQMDSIKRVNLQIWYEPVRIVYLLLISIIFGSEYYTYEQMLGVIMNEDLDD